MNEIMLMFTVATILYLPPTFVAVSTIWLSHGRSTDLFRQTFMALDMFQVNDTVQFWNVLSGTSGVTYLLAVIALLAIYRVDVMGALGHLTPRRLHDRKAISTGSNASRYENPRSSFFSMDSFKATTKQVVILLTTFRRRLKKPNISISTAEPEFAISSGADPPARHVSPAEELDNMNSMAFEMGEGWDEPERPTQSEKTFEAEESKVSPEDTLASSMENQIIDEAKFGSPEIIHRGSHINKDKMAEEGRSGIMTNWYYEAVSGRGRRDLRLPPTLAES
jgi:hypothetical protein